MELLLYNFYEGHLFHNNQINQTSNCQENLFNPNKILRDWRSRMKDIQPSLSSCVSVLLRVIFRSVLKVTSVGKYITFNPEDKSPRKFS